MEHPWLDFWNKTGETLGIAAAFCFGGASFVLWVSNDTYTPRRGLTVIVAGQIVTAAATAFIHGYLGWSIFLAPAVGLLAGLVSLPLLLAIIKVSQDKASDVVTAVVKKVSGDKI
jgi:hypothetical protein